MFSRHLMDGDVLSISAPTGFDLVTRSLTGEARCTSFRYPNVLLPLLNTPDPTCSCEAEGPRCKLVFHMNEGAANGVALLKNKLLEFEIAGMNPVRSPDRVENIWRAALQRGDQLLGSSEVSGWLVYAQPQNISVEITGPFKRAYSESELTISFVPTSWASALKLQFTAPTRFDFSQVLVSAPLERDERSGIDQLVVVRGDFAAYQRTWVVVKKVGLGAIGRKTRMNFMLYSDYFLKYPVGRRFNFTGGFRLPGSVNIRDQ